MKNMNTYKTMNLEIQTIAYLNERQPFFHMVTYGQKTKSQFSQIDFIDRYPPTTENNDL